MITRILNNIHKSVINIENVDFIHTYGKNSVQTSTSGYELVLSISGVDRAFTYRNRENAEHDHNLIETQLLNGGASLL